MKRYFYSDPLAAAWMAKHFGMVTYIGHWPDDIDAYGPTNWWHCQDDWRFRQEKLGQPAPKFFIKPESLPLLEPMIGDLVTNIGFRAWLVERIEDDRLLSGEMFTMKADARIIQRDGEPFFWPESEAA